MFWPGSEARIAGELPRYNRAFDSSVTPDARTDQILAWLDAPIAERPQLLTLYFEQYDVAAHHAGTRSELAMKALGRVDAAIARLREGLRERGLSTKAHLVVVSDHGMADVPRAQRIWMEDVLNPSFYSTEWWGTLIGLRPKPEHTDAVERAFLGTHEHFACWRKGETPAAWAFGQHPRVPPIVCQMRCRLAYAEPHAHDLRPTGERRTRLRHGRPIDARGVRRQRTVAMSRCRVATVR